MKNRELAKFYGGKNVLVTGGLGFIGSNLVNRLVKYSANVTIVDSLRPEMGGNFFNINQVKNKVKVNLSDIRDKQTDDYLVADKDLIFNLAGTLSHVDSMLDPYTDLDINVRGQVSLLEACRENNPGVKIVYAGTRNQYGKIQYTPVDEKHPSVPTDVNSINRVAGEQYHMLYYRDYGIKSCSLRITNTFGPRHQMKHPKQGILNWFIRQAIDGEKITLYGAGNQLRDINYVDDVVLALLMLGAANKVWGEVFNIGGSVASLKEFAALTIKICRKGGIKILPVPNERKIVEIGDYIADYSKLKKTLGWEPKITLEDGIKRTIEYYKKYRKRYW